MAECLDFQQPDRDVNGNIGPVFESDSCSVACKRHEERLGSFESIYGCSSGSFAGVSHAHRRSLPSYWQARGKVNGLPRNPCGNSASQDINILAHRRSLARRILRVLSGFQGALDSFLFLHLVASFVSRLFG